jgi:RNA polymerase sigma-70 factor (TIGR02943 family)
MPNPEKIDSELWVEKYGDMMYRFTLVRVKDQDAAEEVVQQTLIAALQAQKSFQGRSTEKSWLFGILKHKIMDHFRAAKKFQTYDLAPDDDSDPYEKAFDQSKHWKIPVQNWNMDPEKAAQNGQLVDALSHCLDKLSDKYRRIFVMREVDGVSSEEICKEFQVQPTNLWVMLHRVRNQLKKCLETQWFNK